MDAGGNSSPNSSRASDATPALDVTAPTDTTAPSVPTNLTATTAAGAVNLTWTASSDNVALAGYTVYRDGTAIGTAFGPSFADVGVAALI